MIFLRMVLAASIAGLSAFGCDEDEDIFGDSTRLYFHNQLTQSSGGSSDDVVVDFYVDDMSAATRSSWMTTTKTSSLMFVAVVQGQH